MTASIQVSIERARSKREALLQEIFNQIVHEKKLSIKGKELIYEYVQSVKRVEILVAQQGKALESEIRKTILAEKQSHDDCEQYYARKEVLLKKEKRLTQALKDLSHNLEYFQQEAAKQLKNFENS
jgi:hypothetical protein